MWPVQMCFPNGTSSRLISIQYVRGSFSSSARIVSSGDRVATCPRGLIPFCDGVVLTCPKRIRGYPLQCVTVADHLRKRRLDLKLTKLETGRRLGIGPWTYTRWESAEMTIEVHYYPRIIAFLGYNPLPAPTSLAEAVRRERMTRGLPRRALARRLGIQYEGTIQRIEEGARVSSRCLAKVCRALGISQLYNEQTAGGH